jgi:type II restriction enzyme
LSTATLESFSLQEFLRLFRTSPGLRRSIDKAYEIVVYALFDTLVHHLQATVTLSVAQSKKDLLREFEDFTTKVLGLTAESPEITKPAQLHRVGGTHAADRGIDMWANFGPAVQVKHVSLDEDLAADIVDEIAETAMVVIVCENAEQQVIENVLTQAGFSHRVQGIVTFGDLDRWYSKCFERRFAATLGQTLLQSLREEFGSEFPSTGTALVDFQKERGYDKMSLSGMWGLSPQTPLFGALGED